MTEQGVNAPVWRVSQWLGLAPGQPEPCLPALRGKVVVLHAFQMLCPGCVGHGLPQAQRIADHFDPAQVAVIGLHSVFEHHAVMTPEALRVFLHEYAVSFPVAIDQAAAHGPIPLTMQAYALRGTPSLILIDRRGQVRKHWFGAVQDMAVSSAICALLCEHSTETSASMA
ncbi:peroxiredoxin family protein [Oceanococcus atlanticus]|uniref:peroxiredoxin family protein n=1 Tax=Oceanococcus atlanticus TaxID=1317117 RepID=UPI0011BAC96E|nr:TlpA disulfide reductase family protein [Oceanococcus atlanticus]